ncbi:ArnT family glycosyltransferase [Arthrobacter sp. HS15c]
MPWDKVGLVVLLVATAASFLWGLEKNGWANPYYSAAAQAGSQDWKAFLFGSFEWGNLITVDKTPLSIWVMSLSVRLFGLSSWAIIVPQAIMGVATTFLIYRILRRGFGAAPALLGGAIYATTPVVFLMSRYNNPEPLMGLLTVAAVAVTIRGIERGWLRFFAAAGLLLGLAFMAKQIQAFVVIPALCVTVLGFGSGSIPSRLRQLLVAALSLLGTSAAWLVAVELTPPSSRPYIGGSSTNSAIELTLDYNGLARFIQIPMNINGSRSSSQDELATYNGGFSRIFDGNFAPEIAWLLFPAIAVSIVLIVLNRSLNFNRLARKVAVLAVTWFITTFLLLCFMGSMIHTYYTFSLAAPMALVLPIGLSALWRTRDRLILRLVGGVIVGSATYMTIRVLNYSDEWPVWFRVLVISAGAVATAGWLCAASVRSCRVTACVVAVGFMLGPVGANLYTLSVPQKGTNPQSGPVANDPMAMSRLLLAARGGKPAWALQIAYGSTPPAAVVGLIRQTRGEQVWGAATYSAQNAAIYQLESGMPVIPLGGWLGTDPAPTPAQFRGLVADGRIGYFIWQQDLIDRNELSAETLQISRWVDDNFEEQIVDNVRIYDLRH